LNPENIQSLPEVESLGTIDSFSQSNSAVYRGGALVLVAENFQPNPDTNLDEKQIESAKIKISFAIKEKEPDILIEQQETSDGETEDQIGFWGKIKNFFRALVIRTVNLVKASLIKIVSIVRAEDSIPPIDTNIELINADGEETGDEGQETSEEEETEGIEEEPEKDGEETGDEQTGTENQESGEEEEEEIEETEEGNIGEGQTEGNTEEEEEGEEVEEQEQAGEEKEEEPTTVEGSTTTDDEATTMEVIIIKATTTEATSTETTTTEAMSVDDEATTTDEDIDTVPLEDTLPNIDAKIIIWYSLNDQDWQELDTISDYPLSNALNNGYFEYDASFLKSWEDIKNLKIKFEGAIGGETNIIVYLDSVWVETNYEQQETSDQQQETSDQQQETSDEEEEVATTDEEIIEEELEEETEEESIEEVEELEEPEEEPEPKEEPEEEPEEEHQGEIESLSKKNSFRANEKPEFRFRYKKVYYKFLALNKKPDTTLNLTTILLLQQPLLVQLLLLLLLPLPLPLKIYLYLRIILLLPALQ